MKRFALIGLAAAVAGVAAFKVLAQDVGDLPQNVTDIKHGWVILYDDHQFADTTFTIKYPFNHADFRRVVNDRQARGENVDKGFDNKTSSAAWCLPKGYTFVLFGGAI